MNLNDFKTELEGYLGKLSGLMPVGHPWWGFDPKSKPAGVQLFAGQELSREAYPKHWELINSGKRTLVTEEEWQEMVANQGFCQFYSSGDGSTTYRMPLVRGVHPKFVAALAEAGQYLEAGLPDITGTFAAFPVTTSGAIYLDINQPTGDRGAGAGSSVRHIFQASRYNPIYGNSDTVQPEALTLLVGEYVISSVATLSTSESENLLASVTQLEASKLDKTGGGITGNLSVSGDVFVGGTINASISGTSENAVKASQDALGNIIDETYATKASVADVVRSVNGVTPDTAGDVVVNTVNSKSFLSSTVGNQSYIQFESGLQICWGHIPCVTTSTFPQPFSKRPAVGIAHMMGSESGTVVESGVYVTTTTLYPKDNSSSGSDFSVYYVAIGPWK